MFGSAIASRFQTLINRIGNSSFMNRRSFIVHGGSAAVASVLPRAAGLAQTPAPGKERGEPFTWSSGEISFFFQVAGGHLRQGLLLPANATQPVIQSIGVEVAVQYDNENSPDQGMKLGMGQPGLRLGYADKRTEIHELGERLILRQIDEGSQLQVESLYQAVKGCAVVRRWTRLTNKGSHPLGINYTSSAMLHGLAPAQAFEEELRIHLAFNSWMSEAQWNSLKPSELGLVENERTSWSEACASSIGSWSSGKFLPMAMVENVKEGLTWFWQIEHNGSWYWEVSNTSERGIRANDVYAYIGGPDDLHADAWKQLKPGQSYETVPVAVGCVRGGFEEAVAQLTQYRRRLRQNTMSRPPDRLPVIFNDYMNCLWADPTEAKELPMIEAAAAVGCEYYVIDAGWYAKLHEDWSPTLGTWLPSEERWPHGLQFTLDKIRSAGMVPGLWLEPEVAGARSQLAATRPSDWFLQRHGERVLRNSRYMLDFRNPQVTSYLSDVVRRLADAYGIGYIKMDYNVNTLTGTDLNADSPGQGLLEHNRAVQRWLDQMLQEFPALVIENCASGGSRMDYAMLARLQIQSMSDQEDYRRLPSRLVGSTAAVLPEQLGIWAYPLASADEDQASFNMVTAMSCRIHQSGRLDSLSPAASAQVRRAIAIYKSEIRPHLATSIPFYPLGTPAISRKTEPVALGMRSPERTFLYAWRLEGASEVKIPIRTGQPRFFSLPTWKLRCNETPTASPYSSRAPTWAVCSPSSDSFF